ncbi:MAG TPA: DUF4214 domain-containing protein [Pyrinomonadaceae bacterium]|jgi:hypothetical protein
MSKLLKRFPVILLTLLAGLICSSTAFGSANIIIQNTDAPGVGFNDTTPAAPVGGNSGTTVGQQRLIAFQQAAAIWGATITSGPAIVIDASWAAQDCSPTAGTLGFAGTTTVFRNFTGAPVSNTWYPVALANALSGTDRNGATPEIHAQFNLSVGTSECLTSLHWYYGLDNNHGSTGVDLVTVLLHEFGHGLGFQSFTDEETGALFGGTSGGFPSIFDRFLLDNSTGKTWPQMIDSERVASAVNSGNLVWNGPQVLADAGILSSGRDAAGHPRVYAPNPIKAGSSVSHWDTVATPNQLMEPNNSGNLTHSVTLPQDLTFSLLKDIGWCSGCPVATPTPPPPPPANDNFASAQALGGTSGRVTGTNAGATKELGEPSHSPDGNPGGKSVWYSWQAPASGPATFTTGAGALGGGSDFDTVLGVYTGSGVGALTPVAAKSDDQSASDHTSLVSFNAVAGTTYRIAVDGYLQNGNSVADDGSIALSWTLTGSTPTPTPPPVGTSVQFASASAVASETSPSVPVTVTRSGILSFTSSVVVRTIDDQRAIRCDDTASAPNVAFARCDYATTVQTVTFAPGETTKTVNIPLVDDAWGEPTEFVAVTLGGGSGTSIGAQSTTTISILSNEAPGQTGANPSLDPTFFVRMQYLDFLSREPDADGMAAWVGTLNNCAPGDQKCDRASVSAGFFRSTEFEQKGRFVFNFYKVSFGRLPRYSEIVADMSSITGVSTAEVVAKKAAFTDAWIGRDEFTGLYIGMSNTQLVNALMDRYALPSITTPNPATPDDTSQKVVLTRADLVGMMNTGALTRAKLVRAVAGSDEVAKAEFNSAFVAMQYFGYLRRDPDQGGYDDWLRTINANPNDIHSMVNGFVSSIEYRLRFGPQ